MPGGKSQYRACGITVLIKFRTPALRQLMGYGPPVRADQAGRYNVFPDRHCSSRPRQNRSAEWLRCIRTEHAQWPETAGSPLPEHLNRLAARTG